MASVTVYSAAHIDTILDQAVTNATITGGHLILTLGDGSSVDVGAVVTGIPDATDSVKGVSELATDTETLAGTDTTRAVTPFGLKAVANTKQPLDADLTTIASLTATTDSFLQSKAGAWSSRTVAQVVADLNASGGVLDSRIYSGSTYAAASANGAHIYIGTVDPVTAGAAPVNGAIWYDTTGA